MRIGNRSIGPNEPPLIIVEIGINYDGDVEDIKNEEGGLEKLRYILYLIENREDIMFRDLR